MEKLIEKFNAGFIKVSNINFMDALSQVGDIDDYDLIDKVILIDNFIPSGTNVDLAVSFIRSLDAKRQLSVVDNPDELEDDSITLEVVCTAIFSINEKFVEIVDLSEYTQEELLDYIIENEDFFLHDMISIASQLISQITSAAGEIPFITPNILLADYEKEVFKDDDEDVPLVTEAVVSEKEKYWEEKNSN